MRGTRRRSVGVGVGVQWDRTVGERGESECQAGEDGAEDEQERPARRGRGRGAAGRMSPVLALSPDCPNGAFCGVVCSGWVCPPCSFLARLLAP